MVNIKHTGTPTSTHAIHEHNNSDNATWQDGALNKLARPPHQCSGGCTYWTARLRLYRPTSLCSYCTWSRTS